MGITATFLFWNNNSKEALLWLKAKRIKGGVTMIICLKRNEQKYINGIGITKLLKNIAIYN